MYFLDFVSKFDCCIFRNLSLLIAAFFNILSFANSFIINDRGINKHYFLELIAASAIMVELEGKVKSLTSCLEQQKLFLEQTQEEYNSITEVNLIFFYIMNHIINIRIIQQVENLSNFEEKQ